MALKKAPKKSVQVKKKKVLIGKNIPNDWDEDFSQAVIDEFESFEGFVQINKITVEYTIYHEYSGD